MPKIRNWSRVDSPGRVRRYHRPVEELWRHDDRDLEVAVVRESPEVMRKTGGKEYGLLRTSFSERGFENIREPRKFSSIDEATGFARDWMRQNPNP